MTQALPNFRLPQSVFDDPELGELATTAHEAMRAADLARRQLDAAVHRMNGARAADVAAAADAIERGAPVPAPTERETRARVDELSIEAAARREVAWATHNRLQSALFGDAGRGWLARNEESEIAATRLVRELLDELVIGFDKVDRIRNDVRWLEFQQNNEQIGYGLTGGFQPAPTEIPLHQRGSATIDRIAELIGKVLGDDPDAAPQILEPLVPREPSEVELMRSGAMYGQAEQYI